MEVQVITTEDGSSSIYVPSIDESYHSKFGALTESVHVFIKSGLYERLSFDDPGPINLLEVGMGTGLNLLLTILACRKKGISVYYEGLEPYPLKDDLLQSMNYSEILKDKEAKQLFDWIHQCDWETLQTQGEATIIKRKTKLEDYNGDRHFDLVYFDAFAPDKQPELWKPEIFKKTFLLMKDAGILTTYCAKGQVKRDLLGSGFMVENIQGPPGKREMIRATKPPQNS